MATPAPIVSVCMTTYNHEKYISEAIRSVLGQTFADLELIVVDDGSTDATPRVIAGFADPRLVSIRQENQGPSMAVNRALRACRGRHLALMAGDDVCHADRLERQLGEYRRGGTRLLFSPVDLIDDNGRPLARRSFCDGLFDSAPRSRAAIYHRFFHAGNFINGITLFTETEVLRRAGYYDPLLLQLQDFDMWVRLVKQYEFTFLPRSTLNYRVRDGGRNLSAPTEDQPVRSVNEEYLILRRFFDGVGLELFREAFGGELLQPGCETPVEMACEQAFLLVRSLSAIRQVVGMEKLGELLKDPEAAAVLREAYRFDLPAYSRLLGGLTAFNPLRDYQSTLFLDTGEGFHDKDCCRLRVNLPRRRFELTFEPAGAPVARRLRWDPFENRIGRVCLEDAVWQAPGGIEGQVDLPAVSANGVRGADGAYTFETTDPMFVLPFTGPLSRLTLRGWWEVQPAEALSARYHAALAERDALRAEVAFRD